MFYPTDRLTDLTSKLRPRPVSDRLKDGRNRPQPAVAPHEKRTLNRNNYKVVNY